MESVRAEKSPFQVVNFSMYKYFSAYGTRCQPCIPVQKMNAITTLHMLRSQVLHLLSWYPETVLVPYL